MANGIDGIQFKPGEDFDSKKMQTLTEATKEGFDLFRSELNDLTTNKTGIVDRGDVNDPGQMDISDVPNNSFVKWFEEGNRCIGIVLDGELVVIKGRR